ncbi:nicotinate (nicotinamide) nucleotide adenylyltransferase [Desulfovibrio sp. OttesenSCG-928-C06]|nr:nicotinate (nicotinamide) nucleotide adenylyltransferase [Desulfovibrio sp. OttesenSCG-928-C06]
MPDSIILFGGSFNPVHYGHLRLAVEVFEAMLPDRVDFVPCANPPHKAGLGLLPFDMRVEMLREICADYPHFNVNTLEAEREGPSYTSDTLREYKNTYPQTRLFFVLGSEDYVNLDSWKDWNILPNLADILVVPRQGVEEDEFIEHTRRLWPDATPVENVPEPVRIGFWAGSESEGIPMQAGRVLYMPLPRLDINASMVRRRWLGGRLIDFWVPDAVVNCLAASSDTVKKFWK